MLRNREGFTLIELLIVVVIIGIPKFGQSREKAYVSAMQSDLRQIMTAQEIYYSAPRDTDPFTYAANDEFDDLNVTLSNGVSVTLSAEDGPPAGWSAEATHDGTNQICEVFVGENPGSPGNATDEGVIWCGEAGDATGGGGGDDSTGGS